MSLVQQLDVTCSRSSSVISHHRRAPTLGRVSRQRVSPGHTLTKSVSNEEMEEDNGPDSEEAAEDELDVLWRQNPKTDLPTEYWQIRKLLKYARNGNNSVTVISLCVIRDYDLYEDIHQRAIVDERGVELLLNILETKEQRSKVASLNILKTLTTIGKFRQMIVKQLGVESIVRVLDDSLYQVKSLAAEALADLTKGQKSRNLVIHLDGIERLVSLLDVRAQVGRQLDIRGQRSGGAEAMLVAGSAARALAVISRSARSRRQLINAGVLPLVVHLLIKPAPIEALIPTMEMLQNCASEEFFRVAIVKEDLVRHLLCNIDQSKHSLLSTHCANTIFKAAENMDIKNQVRHLEGLPPLVHSMSHCHPKTDEEHQLLAALTGAVWKCAERSPENVNELLKQDAVDALLTILVNESDEDILCNVVGGLAECLCNEQQRATVAKRQAIPHLINLLAKTSRQILINTAKTIIQCSYYPDNMRSVEEEDGIRHLWSLLKNSDPDVQSDAAQAIHSCIDRSPHISELVRNFVGGLELLVNLLSVPQPNVQASVCGVIAAVAKDMDNLAVITDNGAVQQLARLASNGARDYRLQRYLAEAVANCCALESNAAAFGKVNAVVPLVHYLKSSDEFVRKMAARALALLSRDASNCVVMHQNGAVKILLALCGSIVEEIQEDAATTLGNIRRVATTTRHHHN